MKYLAIVLMVLCQYGVLYSQSNPGRPDSVYVYNASSGPVGLVDSIIYYEYEDDGKSVTGYITKPNINYTAYALSNHEYYGYDNTLSKLIEGGCSPTWIRYQMVKLKTTNWDGPKKTSYHKYENHTGLMTSDTFYSVYYSDHDSLHNPQVEIINDDGSLDTIKYKNFYENGKIVDKEIYNYYYLPPVINGFQHEFTKHYEYDEMDRLTSSTLFRINGAGNQIYWESDSTQYLEDKITHKSSYLQGGINKVRQRDTIFLNPDMSFNEHRIYNTITTPSIVKKYIYTPPSTTIESEDKGADFEVFYDGTNIVLDARKLHSVGGFNIRILDINGSVIISKFLEKRDLQEDIIIKVPWHKSGIFIANIYSNKGYYGSKKLYMN